MKLETIAKKQKAVIPTRGSKHYRILTAILAGARITQLDATRYGCTAISQTVSRLINDYGWGKVIKKTKRKIGGSWWMEYSR